MFTLDPTPSLESEELMRLGFISKILYFDSHPPFSVTLTPLFLVGQREVHFDIRILILEPYFLRGRRTDMDGFHIEGAVSRPNPSPLLSIDLKEIRITLDHLKELN